MVKLVTLADVCATKKVLRTGSQAVRDIAQTAILDGGRLSNLKGVTRRALPLEINPDTFVRRGENQTLKSFGPSCSSSYSWHDPNPTGCPGL